jgi:hypothetical protein
MKNIGILASLNPVALDQACVNFVYAASDGRNLIQRIESRNGIHTLEHAEAIGFGTRKYKLISIDSPSTKINELVTNHTFIYPNPSNSIIHIPENESYDYIQIVDLNGKTVAKLKSKPEITINNLTKGKYIVQFIIKGKIVGTTSLIRN